MSRNLMEETGEVETTKRYMHLEKGKCSSCLEGRVDNSHLSLEGALIYAGFIAEGLLELGGVYADLLVERLGKMESTYRALF